MEKNATQDPELRDFRAEAEALILGKPPPPQPATRTSAPTGKTQ